MKNTLQCQIINGLIEHDLIKFSEEGFELKGGILSPIYIDLRSIQSYPDLAILVSTAYVEIIQNNDLKYDHIAAVPYGALGQGYLVAHTLGVSVLTPRKEMKEHGLGGDIVGRFEDHQKVLIIEDLVTKGGSTIETAARLRANNLHVTDVVVLLDREQGAKEKLIEGGIALHHYITMEDIISVVEKKGIQPPSMVKKIKKFYEDSKL